MRAQPLICCRDVEASSCWYRALLGCASAHGGPEYERLVDPKKQRTQYGSEGLILQLHDWQADHEHGPIGDSDNKPYGNGVLLWFEVDDFDLAVQRARDLNAEIVRDVHVNPGPQHRELWLRDLDGYVVVLASPDGDA